jgi:hypothetical protein
MAEWKGHARTNYFNVKDEYAFAEWVEKIGCELLVDAKGRFGFTALDEDNGGFPLGYWDEEAGAAIDTDLEAEIVQFLAEGEVAIFVEVGAEGSRYLTGYAVAVGWDGRKVRVALDDIYQKATELFMKRPTNAAW